MSLICVSERVANLLKIGSWVWVEFLQTFFDGLTRGLYNFGDTASLFTSSSACIVKSIGFTVLGYSLVHMQAKKNYKMKYLEIDSNLLQYPQKILNPYFISNFERQFYEWDIVLLYVPKYQVRILFLILVPMLPHHT